MANRVAVICLTDDLDFTGYTFGDDYYAKLLAGYDVAYSGEKFGFSGVSFTNL